MTTKKITHLNIKNKKNLIPKDILKNKNISIQLYKFAKRLRIVEQKLAEEYHPSNQMRCPVHFCIGQEAVPSVLNYVMKKKDFLFSHHRSHGYFLSKNGPLKKLVAELYGKKNGANGGIAGSQDISYHKNNFFSGAILAGSIGIAIGNAMAQKIDNNGGITVVGFGESACDVGLFWESVNYAFLKKLPILFLCENNNYSVFSPQIKRQAGKDLNEKVKTFGNYSEKIFGNNIYSLYEKINRSINIIRNKKHPFFLEVLTYRISSHYGPESDVNVGYRSNSEIDFWKKLCPVKTMEKNLLNKKFMNKKSLKFYEDKYLKEISEAINFSKKSDFPNKINFKNLNYGNETIEQRRIKKISRKLTKAIPSKKNIIGY